ncbi:MAG: hypothetical protein ACI94O_002108 [Octadecabacter sp.]|jgi:hypothetical protein
MGDRPNYMINQQIKDKLKLEDDLFKDGLSK